MGPMLGGRRRARVLAVGAGAALTCRSSGSDAGAATARHAGDWSANPRTIIRNESSRLRRIQIRRAFGSSMASPRCSRTRLDRSPWFSFLTICTKPIRTRWKCSSLSHADCATRKSWSLAITATPKYAVRKLLSNVIAELLREGDQIPLAGLAETEVARMVEARAALAPSASFVADLHRATAGNPLFVDGVVRVLIAEGKLAGAKRLDLSGFKLPEGSRGAIRKRLAMLSSDAQALLAVAAVIGQEFESRLLERVSSLPVESAVGSAGGGGRGRPHRVTRRLALPIHASFDSRGVVQRVRSRRTNRVASANRRCARGASTRRTFHLISPNWRITIGRVETSTRRSAI